MATLTNTTINSTGYLQLPAGTTAQRPASPVAGMIRRNTDTGYLEVYNGTAWRSILTKRNISLGSSADAPAQSARQIQAAYPNAPSGLYWIRPQGWGGAAQQVYCDMDWFGGGWTLVASTNAGDSVIPGGQSRHSTDYELDRTGELGTPSPNNDYIIGSIINSMHFTQGRITAFGGTEPTNTAYVWPTDGNTGNLGLCGTWTWEIPSQVTGVSRLTTPVPRWESVRCYGSTSPNANYFVLDGIKADRINGGYAANANQTTVGGVGVQASDGDPDSGCYIGHGTSEGSYDGWYPQDNQAFDCRGWTTWVR